MVNRTGSQTAKKPRPWLGWLVGAGMAWLLLIGYAERRLEGNHLWLMGATYDAGQVRAGTLITHRVWVFNPMLRALEVEPVPSCGCMVADTGKRGLSPLSGFFLTVQVDTSGKPLGKQSQSVDLVVRDGRYSWRERLEVRFEVVAHASRSR
ncbi:MAG: hypothetical protein QXI60_07795 [Thermofilaceae archaeon]